jgi:hypothetical protein
MIPQFNGSGMLPAGIHWADLNEIDMRYGQNSHRKRLLSGFRRGLVIFRAAGCSIMYLDGSFVTDKEFPSDFDACWEAKGVTLAALDPVLLDFRNRRAAQKAKYLGEFFPAHLRAQITSPFLTFFNFFQQDKATGDKKGIIGINLKVIV